MQCIKLFPKLLIAKAVLISSLLFLNTASADHALEKPWSEVVDAARGQTVYFNAWAGKAEINSYIAWLGEQVKDQFDITLEHVKLESTATAVARVIAEKSAGRNDKGSVDLVWLNGEHFATLKTQGLLFGPWTQKLPNYAAVATNKPTNLIDFGEPVDHMEAPWGMAQVTFAYNPKRMPNPPRNSRELLSWAKENPGRMLYPSPENFIGRTFLKQVLVELVENQGVLFSPVEDADFQNVTAILWQYLDALHPFMWRQGNEFPADEVQQRTMLADGQVDFNITFGPADTTAAITQGFLPPHIRTFVFEDGTIGNTHFVGIPFNSSAKEAAMVVANYMLSPKAQSEKQKTSVWGDITVLDMTKLAPEDRNLFRSIPRGFATLSVPQLGLPLSEPHYSWGPALTKEWLERYR